MGAVIEEVEAVMATEVLRILTEETVEVEIETTGVGQMTDRDLAATIVMIVEEDNIS